MTSPRTRPRADARLCALRALLRMDGGEAAQHALDAVLRESALPRRDAALCTELTYGFLRTELRLEAVLRTLLSKPHKLPREMYLTLGLAAYTLLFLRRIPAHAALDAAVGHVRARFGQGLARVANGALRSLQRLGTAPQEADFYAAMGRSPLERQAIFYSMPLWIAALWQEAFGEETAVRLMARAFAQPRACVRVNAGHVQAHALRAALLAAGGEAVPAHGVAFAPGTAPELILEQPLSHWHDAGALSWQAAGSQWALERMAPWEDPVWDACAGQGGKSLALAEQGAAVGLCSDVHTGRLKLLQRTAQRLGVPCPPVAVASMTQPPVRRWGGTLLLDVPCSGFGTLARRPEIRRRRQPVHVRELMTLQGAMLRAAWQCLKPGAALVYMTCTLNPAENETQVQDFLRAHKDASLTAEWQTPHEHPWLEGMYAARMVKKGTRGGAGDGPIGEGGAQADAQTGVGADCAP